MRRIFYKMRYRTYTWYSKKRRRKKVLKFFKKIKLALKYSYIFVYIDSLYIYIQYIYFFSCVPTIFFYKKVRSRVSHFEITLNILYLSNGRLLKCSFIAIKFLYSSFLFFTSSIFSTCKPCTNIASSNFSTPNL